MAVEVFANTPFTSVLSGGTDAPASGTQETWTVASSAEFPAASATAVPPTQFHVGDPAAPTEIVAVTNVSGTTWTVTRGAESTTPLQHLADFAVWQVTSAGAFGAFAVPLAGSRLLSQVSVPPPSGDTSGATDTPVIQALENAAASGGGKLVFAPGAYWVTGLTKQSFTYWEGAGEGATFLNLAAGANVDVVQGAGFSSLTMTGANAWGSSGIWDWGISRMCVDGNAANQSGTSYGLRVYGYGWNLDNLVVRNCLTDDIWTEWGALATNSPVTAEDNVATATNIKTSFAGRHGWTHLGPSDCRFTAVETFQNNQNHGAAGIGLWALNDQISNVMATASAMNGTSASGFTGTFTVQAAQLGGATDLYAGSGTLKVTTSSGTAVMTYTGKTATTFTGCTVTSGAGTFVTGNSVVSSTQRFTCNGLQTTACHSWSVNHTWATVFDGQVTDSNSHWEGAQYGQALIRSSTNKAGGFVYDITTQFPAGCGFQLGDNGATGGVPLSAIITANSCDLRTRTYSFLHDTAAHSSVNWVSATQSSVDIAAVTRQSGTYATTIASGSNGVDLSTFTSLSPGTLFVASTQNIPNGAGTLTVATAEGNQTATFTSTNGNNGGSQGTSRTAGTQFNGVVASTAPTGSTMSTGGAVSLQNVGSVAVGGSADSSSRIRVQCQSSTTALSTGASVVQEAGARNLDLPAAANGWTLRVNGTQAVNFSGSSLQMQFPNSTDLRGYSDNFLTKTWEIPGTGDASFTQLALTGSAGSSSSALTALGAAPVQAASAVFKPADPTGNGTGTFAMMGLGATCHFTPAGTGKVLVIVTGIVNCTTSAGSLFVSAAYGTSIAPINGAAAAGTRFGVGADANYFLVLTTGTTTTGVPVTFQEIVSLTPSTAYWFDTLLANNGSGVATMKNITVSLIELAQ